MKIISLVLILLSLNTFAHIEEDYSFINCGNAEKIVNTDPEDLRERLTQLKDLIRSVENGINDQTLYDEGTLLVYDYADIFEFYGTELGYLIRVLGKAKDKLDNCKKN